MLLSGIGNPGVYVTDEDGTVIAKFFHDSYRKRDSAERYIDAALGRPALEDSAPQASGRDHAIKLTLPNVAELNVWHGKAEIRDIELHRDHGQPAGNYDGTPALRRLLARKVKQHPQGVPILIGKNLWLQLMALKRRLIG